MRLMLAANILSVFVGVESPNEASLWRRKASERQGRAHASSSAFARFSRRGWRCGAGMIMGFDHDDETVFDAQASSCARPRIAQAMIGMLYAIPKTPLHARLAAEGRLDPTRICRSSAPTSSRRG